MNDQTPSPTCRADGCTRRRMPRRSLCRGHQGRWLVSRDVRAHVPLTAAELSAGGRTAAGYASSYAPSHPVASSNGQARRARAVLFEKLGSDLTAHVPCRWCGTTLRWSTAVDAPGYLTCDHLDGDRDDDRPENLVPACRSCNTSRARRGNRLDFVPVRVLIGAAR